MKRSLAIITALIMCLALCLPAGAAMLQADAPLSVRGVPSEVPASAQEWEVLRLVNIERMNNGLLPLTMFSAMQTATDIRALELLQSFSHTRPDGTSCFTVFDEVGIEWSNVGENIAAGQQTPAAVMNSWMNSSGHRANILSPDFKHIGVGYTYSSGTQYGAYWVQLFCTGFNCHYTSFEILGEADMSTSVDGLELAGRFTCGEGYCYMPLTSAMCVGDSTANGVRTLTFSCFGLTATVSASSSLQLGDVDGDGTVSISDALLAMRHAMGVISLPADRFERANIDGDGDVDISDAVSILRLAMGIE